MSTYPPTTTRPASNPYLAKIHWLEVEENRTIDKSAKRKHARSDRWVHPDKREETSLALVRFVIRRIEFPRFGEPFRLSHTDRQDAEQAGMIACWQAGFFRHGFAKLPVIRAIRNAIQSRACLRMRCRWEDATDKIGEVAESVGLAQSFEHGFRMFGTDLTVKEYTDCGKRLRKSQVIAAREVMRTLRASCEADKGRKSSAAFKSQRDFFLIVLGYLTGRTARAMSSGTFDTRKSRFIDYLAKGAEQLRATRRPAPSLAAEIMSALAGRALA